MRKSSLIYLWAVFCMFLTSCGVVPNVRENSIEKSLAMQSTLLFDKILESYQVADELIISSNFDGALAKSISSGYDENTQNNAFEDSFADRTQYFRYTKQVMLEYSILSDEKFLGKQEALKQMLLSCCDILVKSNDSSNVANAKAINSYLKSSRFDQNDVICLFVKVSADIYNRDLNTINDKLKQAYKDYTIDINNMQADQFDQEKLQKSVEEPYSDKSSLVKVYKNNLIKERYNKIHSYIKDQNNILEASANINQAFGEFIKKASSESVIRNYLSKSEVLLNQISSTKENE